MGLFDWVIVIEPQCEIDTVWKWLISPVQDVSHYPCVGLLYWLTFPFMADFGRYSEPHIPPAWFVITAWIFVFVGVMLATIKNLVAR